MQRYNLQKTKALRYSARIRQRREYYEDLLNRTPKYSLQHLYDSEAYMRFLCLRGQFEKATEMLEPVILDYQSYPFSHEIISCFNMMGVAAYGQMEYEISRYYYGVALKLAMEHQVKLYYSYEYSNIALSYIAEENYPEAISSNQLAIQYMADSDADMGAYIFINETIIYLRTNQFQKAQEAYEIAVKQYDSEKVLPYDSRIYGAVLYYHLGQTQQYEALKEQLLQFLEDPDLETLHTEEFIDICRELFGCGMDCGDDAMIQRILFVLDQYILLYSAGAKMKSFSADLKYQYAAKKQDFPAMLDALEQKNLNLESIVHHSEHKRVQLLRQHHEISAQLQSAIASKEQASQVKTQFLANMSHDIRTPMNAIVGLAKLMEHDIDAPEKNRKHLAKLDAASQHLLSLINDVLDMSRIESGEVVLNRESVILTEQVEQIESIVRPQTDARGQEFTVSMLTDHTFFVCDAVRLRQVVLNMLSNAIKYTPYGGKISLELSDAPDAQADMVDLVIQVTDNGCGMREDFLDHIFEPFSRADNHLTNKVQGTGLGMAITKKIVDLMGGTISVRSELGKGSRFTVILPLQVDSGAEHHTETQSSRGLETSPENSILKGMRFLCAEDNPLNAQVLEALLDIYGAAYTMYDDGKQLVDAFFSIKPGEYTAILTDVQMPVMDGLEAAKAIRSSANPLGKNIPIIAMTANAFVEDVRRCLDAGMDGHVAKPIDMQTLERTLSSILKKKQSQS